MKGDLTLQILKIIQAAQMATADILDTITYFGYTESYRRMRGLKSMIPKRKPILEKTISKLNKRQKASKLLYKLKSEGLIVKNNKTKNGLWKITEKGKSWMERIKPNLKPQYKIEGSNELKIIIFDIPEKERRARGWLRDVLKNLKFQMLQKSVWIGKTILPEEFFIDLQRQNILPYIEIFAITKTGSIKQVQ